MRLAGRFHFMHSQTVLREFIRSIHWSFLVDWVRNGAKLKYRVEEFTSLKLDMRASRKQSSRIAFLRNLQMGGCLGKVCFQRLSGDGS
jgi:hypothetical protein